MKEIGKEKRGIFWLFEKKKLNIYFCFNKKFFKFFNIGVFIEIIYVFVFGLKVYIFLIICGYFNNK